MSLRLVGSVLVLSIVGSTACGNVVVPEGSGGDGGGSTTGVTSSVTTGTQTSVTSTGTQSPATTSSGGPVICGGKSPFSCGPTEFCDFEPEAHCGYSDATGVCQPRPGSCSHDFDPVCGCDGNTYSNECEANQAGSSVLNAGECQFDGKACNGLWGDPGGCPTGYFCDYQLSDICGDTDMVGHCSAFPSSCPDTEDPVCGCDYQPYLNQCTASMHGVGVRAYGSCGLD